MIGVEPVDRLDEPEPRDLDQIVERLAAVHEPARDVARDPQMILDELVAKTRIARVAVAREALVGLAFRTLVGHALPQLARLVSDAVSMPLSLETA